MKKVLFPFFLMVLFYSEAPGQDIGSYGRPIAEIFTDFHINFNDTTRHTGFDLNRAYLGYHFMPGGNLSGKLIINAGSPEDLADGSVPRRYAYFREASLIWSDDKLTVSFGITGTKIFEYQQKFWGKRYIANTYQSINGYGFVADLGVVIDYIFSDKFRADLSFMNGEGYCNLQLDNNIRSSVGLTITPVKGLSFRLYGDIQKMEGLWQPVVVVFAGFKNDLITAGAEASYKSNIDKVQGHHAWGISTTNAIRLSKNLELFARYDLISSVTNGNEVISWNYLKDGNFLVTGIEYLISPNSRIAFDYQGRYPNSSEAMSTDMIFLNLHFKF